MIICRSSAQLMLVQGLADEDGATAKTVSDFFHDPRRITQGGTSQVVVDVFNKMLLGATSSARGQSTQEAEEVCNKTNP